MTRGQGRISPRAGAGGRSGRRRGSGSALTLAPPPRTAGRRQMSGAVVTVLVTLAVAIGSYAVSARVSAERQDMERKARANAALAREVQTLGQELRVRMRLPQLQSWNDTMLRMQPASARQLLGGTAELAVYAIDRPVSPGPVLVSAPEPPALLPGLPRPASAPSLPSPVAPADPAGAQVPGLVLASVGAVIDAAIAAAPEEGSGGPPGDLPPAPDRAGPVEP